MGRWAQSVRGGRATVVVSPPLPPAPTVQIAGDDIMAQSQDTDDTGGLLRLYFSESEGGPFEQGAEIGWQAEPAPIAEVINFGGYYVYCTEVGNGINYVGESPPGNVILVP